MSTVSDSINLTIEQKITPTIFEALWKLDPIYPMMARSSTNVVRRGIGKGWKVLKTWAVGVAGGAKFMSAQGGNVISGPNNFVMYDQAQTFQSLDETTGVAFHQSEVQLIEHRGNIFLPHQLMRADQLTASIGSVVAQNLKAIGTLLAQQEAAVFYATHTYSGSPTVALATLGNTSDTISNHSDDSDAIVFDMTETDATGRIHRFRHGMMVDLYDSTGATKRNASFYLVVDNVDPIDKKLTLRRVDGGDFQTDTSLAGGITYGGGGGDDDLIVIKDSIGVTPGSLDSWIADGSTITDFFGIDVRDYGMYKSYVPSAINAVLTESTLNRHWAAFYEAFPGKELNAAISTMGVLVGFIDNIDTYNQAVADQPGRMRYDRNGKILEVDAGFGGFKYRFAGRPCEIFTSTYAASGTLYAGSLKNGAITRFVPPSIPGAKVDARFGAECEFIATLGGSGGFQGIFKHAHSASGATTDFVEAPFVRQWACMPEQANFLKLTGLTEVIG